MRNVFQHLVRGLYFERPQLCQRREALENTDEKRRIAPFGDAAEFSDLDVGCDSVWFVVRVHVPFVHYGSLENRMTLKALCWLVLRHHFATREEERRLEVGRLLIISWGSESMTREELVVSEDWGKGDWAKPCGVKIVGFVCESA